MPAAYIWIWHSFPPGHVPATALHLKEKAQHAGYKAPVETDKLKSFHFSQMDSKTKRKAPEDELAKEMTHDFEMNFNKIAPFGKEDTAKELQDHAAKTQDTLVDAVKNAEVAEIKRAVFRALTRLRAASIKEFDTIARFAREEDAARAYDRTNIAAKGHAEANTNFPAAEYRAEWVQLELSLIHI